MADYFQNEQEIIDHFNEKFPLKLKYFDDIINRVHKKYPLLEKDEIATICLTFWETIREYIILGKTLKIQGFLYFARLFLYKKKVNGEEVVHLKVKLSTPPEVKNG